MSCVGPVLRTPRREPPWCRQWGRPGGSSLRQSFGRRSAYLRVGGESREWKAEPTPMEAERARADLVREMDRLHEKIGGIGDLPEMASS